MRIGEAAGSALSLPAEIRRTSGLEMTGAGNIDPAVVPEAVKQVWEWMGEQKLQVDVEEIPLKDIAEAWQRNPRGKRIVIVP